MAGTEGEEISLLSPATHCWREVQGMKTKMYNAEEIIEGGKSA